MDLSSITVADFKAQFRKDFPYLPTYDAAKLYNIGARVYYPTTDLFYDCKVNGTINILPTVGANWDLANPQPSTDDYIQDSDITRAFLEAAANFNQAIWGDDATIKMVYLYLTAHYLVMDTRAAAGGVAANPIFLVSSRTVGNVSESYGIPARYLENPLFAYLATSPYGLKYLSLLVLRLVGNFQGVCGGTTP
jgi:hypothetical protein